MVKVATGLRSKFRRKGIPVEPERARDLGERSYQGPLILRIK